MVSKIQQKSEGRGKKGNERRKKGEKKKRKGVFM